MSAPRTLTTMTNVPGNANRLRAVIAKIDTDNPLKVPFSFNQGVGRAVPAVMQQAQRPAVVARDERGAPGGVRRRRRSVDQRQYGGCERVHGS